MSIEAAPPSCPGSRPEVTDLGTTTGHDRRFTLTFTPGQVLSDHSHADRLEFRVMQGGGELVLAGSAPRALAVGDHFQLDPGVRHGVIAGPVGLVLLLRTTVADCDCC